MESKNKSCCDKNANAVMVNVPVMDVKRESPATATVIVPAVK